ncbi:hypothetical protein HCC70_03530 [Streptococcus suis]|uniref:Uncharacterized protein n=1 Tax=Streptococcus suivaginalis TaxID=3028082 RepID=A0AA96ZZ66_9STRE|nr:hypothetical protein [Streptococcus sp. 29896]MCK4027411.1 hypothetical protein [Streptococcus suis]WNY47117.1 hypothetical protein PXH68_09625 [Streptococcus sp. 29896]
MCSDGGRYPLKLDRAKVLDAGIGIRLSWTQSNLNHPKKITHSKAIILAQAYLISLERVTAGNSLGFG